MRITRRQLRRIIKEEKAKLLREAMAPSAHDDPYQRGKSDGFNAISMQMTGPEDDLVPGDFDEYRDGYLDGQDELTRQIDAQEQAQYDYESGHSY